ncbi:hypothetical protein OGAPHI_002234 [Ogataea philodendri]|uniref:Major facilitator superfamily (MFS) profile domain-containing protein n=1 Tax=Ogataea philodendri TaxID=1378263 RepID=A0A9P8T7S4_9ASCO|nr:uncharacterized protein OGAPHI_002234 [Ogataea philodendri]KAH3668480.1 hypothetical protein OGAPHI_002234 [Ogataea philodendri]
MVVNLSVDLENEPKPVQQPSDSDDNEIEFKVASPTFDAISKPRLLIFVILMAITQIFAQALLAQSLVPSLYIARSFQKQNDPGEISWMTAAYSLTVGTFILISGRLGDLLGYKKVYVASYISLSVWSLLAGISRYSGSIEFFDVCRAFQGLSVSGAVPNALGLMGHYFPQGKLKNMAFGLFGAVAPMGFVFGALLSSIFAEFTFWPWSFYATAIICLAKAAVSLLIIPKNIATVQEKLRPRHFDLWGSVTGVIGLVLINFAFNQGPVVGWEKPYVYVLLIIGFIFMVAFAWTQRVGSHPLLPKLNLDVIFTLCCIALGWSSFGIWIFYTFRFAYDILDVSPLVASVQFLPSIIAGMVAGMATAQIITKVPSSIMLTIALACFVGGLVIMGLRPEGQIYWAQKFPSIVIACFGMDISFPSGIIILSTELPRRHQGLAASLVTTVVNYSISIGLGLAGTIEYYKLLHGASTYTGIRCAFYMGMALAASGFVLALVFVYHQLIRKR